MKVLLAVLLIALAALEFFHQLNDEHAADALACMGAQQPPQACTAGERIRQHNHNH